MANLRRFLRYDVDIPIFLERLDEEGQPIGLSEQNFLPNNERFFLEGLRQELENAIDRLGKQSPNSVYVLYQLVRPLDLIAFLLDKLAENRNPTEDPTYNYRMREHEKIDRAAVEKMRGSKIGVLLLALLDRLMQTVREIRGVIELAEDNLFVFPLNPVEPFDHSVYVKNLDRVAHKGNLVADTILLIEKLYNGWLKVLQRLKEFYAYRARVRDWPVCTVNLSAGGIGVWVDGPWSQLERLNVYMRLDTLVAAHGKVVFVREFSDHQPAWRVGVDFEWLPAAKQKLITLFVQRRELEDTMAQCPHFPGLPA
ncbi:PilZ domain-containing protein [Sulfurivirga sp.]|uniref:PilZ domain-containing protein n=1 Tax=Sulfurivirga sp. TaxID=2614236 RepID=UPI0025F5B21A|nr:PilZ domain-containing protein [Sulfurivirga sp.]